MLLFLQSKIKNRKSKILVTSDHYKTQFIPIVPVEPSYIIYRRLCAEKQERKKGAFKAPFFWLVAGPTRLELATSGVTGRRSNQLNYDPVFKGAQ